jgi:hypothetical protein
MHVLVCVCTYVYCVLNVSALICVSPNELWVLLPFAEYLRAKTRLLTVLVPVNYWKTVEKQGNAVNYFASGSVCVLEYLYSWNLYCKYMCLQYVYAFIYSMYMHLSIMYIYIILLFSVLALANNCSSSDRFITVQCRIFALSALFF